MSIKALPLSEIASAEKAVLGSILLNPESFYEVSEILQESDFVDVFHQNVFSAMKKLVVSVSPIDIIGLEREIKKINDKRVVNLDLFVALCDLQELTPSSRNVMAYAEIVLDVSTRTQARTIANNLAINARSDDLSIEDEIDRTVGLLGMLGESRASDKAMIAGSDAVMSCIESLEIRINSGGINSLLGVSTGFEGLDELTSGFVDKDLIIVAARPSMGKTTFALNIVESVMLSEEDPVLMFSLEMPTEQIMSKLVCSIGNVDLQSFRTGDLTEDDWAKISYAMGIINDSNNIYIDDTSQLTPNQMRTRAKKIARKHGGISMVVVDYLQLMRSSSKAENRNLEIADISSSLKALAKELKCPVVALSQLNRSLEQRSDKRPMNSDLRESGSIEQDADVIMFVYRDEIYNSDTDCRNQAEIIIGKQRNGPLGTVLLNTRLSVSKFENKLT